MIDCIAKFTANNVKIEARLSSGETVEIYTSLTTSGHYKSWWEYPCEPQYGSVQYSEQDIDENDIEPYQIIEIYSGVGSGKNYWVEKLASEGKSIIQL